MSDKKRDSLVLREKEYTSRLIIGSGKYSSFKLMAECLEASGAEIITVAVRRVNLDDPNKESLLDYINKDKYTILPNTAGCYTAKKQLPQLTCLQKSVFQK